MIDAIANKVTLLIKNNSSFSDEDNLAKINYGFQVLFGEALKIIIIIAIFSLLGSLKHLLFSMCILFTTRPFMGGYHAKNFTSCLIASIMYFAITTILGPKIPLLPLWIYYVISAVLFLIVYVKAPFPNRIRPRKNEKRRQASRKRAIFSVISWFIILLFLINKSVFLNCGFLTLILQTIQIFFIKEGV